LGQRPRQGSDLKERAVEAIGEAQAGALMTMLRHIPGKTLGEVKLGQEGAALASTAKKGACHNGGRCGSGGGSTSRPASNGSAAQAATALEATGHSSRAEPSQSQRSESGTPHLTPS